MNVTITSYHQMPALDILKEEFAGPDLERIFVERNTITMEFHNDLCYREIAAWIAAALGCGLIAGGTIER